MDRVGDSFAPPVSTVDNTAQKALANGSAPVTASGATNGVDVSDYDEGLLVINVSAATGTTPTLNLVLETYDSLNNLWAPVPGVTIAQLTGQTATPLAYAVSNFGEQVRLSETVGGTTPSFTYTATFIGKSK